MLGSVLEMFYNETAGSGVATAALLPNQNCLGGLSMAAKAVAAAAAVYQCKSCERELSANDFYASNQSKCKECVKARVCENRAAKADYYRAYDARRYKEDPRVKERHERYKRTDAGKAAFRRANEKYKAENPEKCAARYAVNNAIRDGRLERGSECYFCAATEGLHGHHEDYSKPLEVVWLCTSCHSKLHVLKGDHHRTNPEWRA